MDEERESHGIVELGEAPTVIRRRSLVEADHSQAFRSGRESALRDVLGYATQQHERVPKYEDTRPWIEIRMHVTDLLKELDNGAA